MIINLKKGEAKNLSAHFNSREFDCHCPYYSCSETHIDTDLIDKLEAKREIVGQKIHINSGFRCSAHNRDIGGKIGSYHLLGKAADVRVDRMSVADLEKIMDDFDGVGVYPKKGFVHVDVRGYRSRWVG